MLLLGLGLAEFIGTHFAASFLQRGYLYPLLLILPLALAATTLSRTAGAGLFWVAAATLVAWGTLNAAIPVCWSTWLARELVDEPKAGGGLIVSSIKLAIVAGGSLGRHLLDALVEGRLLVAALFLSCYPPS